LEQNSKYLLLEKIIGSEKTVRIKKGQVLILEYSPNIML
jgi:hypothetical protein